MHKGDLMQDKRHHVTYRTGILIKRLPSRLKTWQQCKHRDLCHLLLQDYQDGHHKDQTLALFS